MIKLSSVVSALHIILILQKQEKNIQPSTPHNQQLQKVNFQSSHFLLHY